MSGTVHCKLELYGGKPHAGVCEDCEARNKVTGLGDIVARIAQPIAGGFDALLGTKLAQCGGCEGRQEALNKAFPLTTKPKQGTDTEPADSPQPLEKR